MHPIDGFLRKNRLEFVGRVATGRSANIFLVKNSRGKRFALKLEKEKSTRVDMVKKEAENLELANSVGVGPKFVAFDVEKRIVLWEFVEGVTFDKWLFETNVSKEKLCKLIIELLKQGEKMDEIGLDHGQLAGVGKNIIVRKNKPVIIDFEKGSQARKAHNVGSLRSFLFLNPHSSISKRVKGILGRSWEDFTEH